MLVDLSTTEVFAKFPTASPRSNAVRSGLRVAGHFGLLAVSLGAVFVTGVGSVYSPYRPQFSGAAIIGAWIFMAFVGRGILSDSFLPALWGTVYVAGLAAFMWLGDYLLGAAPLFGSGYLGISFLLTVVTGLIWLDSRLRGRV